MDVTGALDVLRVERAELVARLLLFDAAIEALERVAAFSAVDRPIGQVDRTPPGPPPVDSRATPPQPAPPPDRTDAHRCDTCGDTFTTAKGLGGHVSGKHTPRRPRQEPVPIVPRRPNPIPVSPGSKSAIAKVLDRLEESRPPAAWVPSGLTTKPDLTRARVAALVGVDQTYEL